MGLTVDTIESLLVAKVGQYVKDMDTATQAHIRWRNEVSGGNADRSTEASAARKIATVKRVADTEKVEAKSAAAAVKAAEREKQTAIAATAKAALARATAEKAAAAEVIAAAEREAATRIRLAAVAERAVAGSRITPSTSGRIGATVANEASGQSTIPLAVLNGGVVAEVEAEKEINHLLIDRATLQAGLVVADKEEKNLIRDQLTELKLINDYKRAGLSETEAAILAEKTLANIEAARARNTSRSTLKQTTSGAGRFVEGAGIGRTGGSVAALGGIAAAGTIAAVVSLADKGLEYAHNLAVLSDELGLTTKDLQVYQTAAAEVNVTNEQLRTSFSTLSSNIGRAQEGSEQQSKIFKALNIDIGNAKDGYKTLGDILPTLVDRLSQIGDKTQRNAIETALGGEQLRKLDPILSGGTDKINALADGLERTGNILSSEDIARSAQVANDLKRVGDELTRDLASFVSHNAAQIEILAKAFLNAASGALTLLDRLQRLGAAKVAQGPSNDQNSEAARNLLNQTPEGRQTRFRQNSAALAAVRQAQMYGVGPGIGSIYVPGIGDVANTPAALASAHKQLIDQRRVTLAANGAADAANAPVSVQAGRTGNVAGIFAPKAPKGPKGKTDEQLAAEAAERDRKFTADEARLQDERIQLLTKLTSDTDKQDEYALQRIEADRKARDQEFTDEAEAAINRGKLKGAQADLVNKRRDELIKQNDLNASLQRDVIARDGIADDDERALKALQIAADIRTEQLNDQLALAKTAKERRQIEHELLIIAANQKKAALDEQINNPKTDPKDLPGLRDQRAQVDRDTASKDQQNNRTNAGPWDQFRDSIHRSKDQINEDLQSIAVQGIQSLNDGLADAILHSKSLGDVFHNVADQILSDLIKIGLQMLESQIFGGGSGGAAGGGGTGGGILGPILSFGASLFGGGHAGGGRVSPGKFYKVNEFGTEGYAAFDKPGKIIPLGEMHNSGGGRTTIIHQGFTLDARYGITTPELLEHVNQVASVQAARAGKASFDASQQAAPGRLKQYQTLEA